MKIKMFLRGFGVGVIITALILCITYRNGQKHNNVIQQAKELGMEFPKNETEELAEAAETAEPEASEPTQEPEKPVSGAAVQEESGKDKKAKDKLDKSGSDITSASEYQKDGKTFVVRSGLRRHGVPPETCSYCSVVRSGAHFLLHE